MNENMAYPNDWPAISEALLRQARQDVRTYALDVNMNAARRGLHAGMADVEQILAGFAGQMPDAFSLRALRQRLEQRKYRYLNQPGDDGVWECSVIAMAVETIDRWLAPPA